ncbi:hypothetical protein [Altererythrobacter palmitatis]|uniref:hypothetical protein n=1 Tax=Alteraurantiacibacter palmitatis TaxID=2054628 RepID=UPI00301ACDC1
MTAGSLALAGLLVAGCAHSSEGNKSIFTGPAKFCGYATVIALREGETITPQEGGIHSGRYVWDGEFGRLEVQEIGWAAAPVEAPMQERTAAGMIQFAERKDGFRFVQMIWNGEHGVASFISPRRFSRQQIDAVGRVTLFNEGQRPQDCEYNFLFGGFDAF